MNRLQKYSKKDMTGRQFQSSIQICHQTKFLAILDEVAKFLLTSILI